MLTAAQAREQAAAVKHVFEFLRRHGLALADLIEVGGEDLKSPNPKCVERARRVERCWTLIARLGLAFATLESSSHANSAPHPCLGPEKPSRRRRGKGGFVQVPENKELLDIEADGGIH
jgi:hypothetical protein